MNHLKGGENNEDVEEKSRLGKDVPDFLQRIMLGIDGRWEGNEPHY